MRVCSISKGFCLFLGLQPFVTTSWEAVIISRFPSGWHFRFAVFKLAKKSNLTKFYHLLWPHFHYCFGLLTSLTNHDASQKHSQYELRKRQLVHNHGLDASLHASINFPFLHRLQSRNITKSLTLSPIYLKLTLWSSFYANRFLPAKSWTRWTFLQWAPYTHQTYFSDQFVALTKLKKDRK